MVVSEDVTANLERFLVQRLRLGVLPLGLEIPRHAEVAICGIRVRVAKQPPAKLERFFKKRLRLGVLPLAAQIAPGPGSFELYGGGHR